VCARLQGQRMMPQQLTSLAQAVLHYDPQVAEVEEQCTMPRGASKIMLQAHYKHHWEQMLRQLDPQQMLDARVRLQSVTNVLLTRYSWDPAMHCSPDAFQEHYRYRHGLQPISKPFRRWCRCPGAEASGWSHAYSCRDLVPDASRQRHDHIKQLIARWLQAAMIGHTVEPSRSASGLEYNRQLRPDISLWLDGPAGQETLVDVTVTDPHVGYSRTYATPGDAAAHRERAKESKYRRLGALRMATINGAGIETYGAFGPQLRRLIAKVARAAGDEPSCPYTATELKFGMTTSISAGLVDGMHRQLTDAVCRSGAQPGAR